jgi:hypothetical protein
MAVRVVWMRRNAGGHEQHNKNIHYEEPFHATRATSFSKSVIFSFNNSATWSSKT